MFQTDSIRRPLLLPDWTLRATLRWDQTTYYAHSKLLTGSFRIAVEIYLVLSLHQNLAYMAIYSDFPSIIVYDRRG